jgi:polysaccharide pyruvyl transferase WcaK-like protein
MSTVLLESHGVASQEKSAIALDGRIEIRLGGATGPALQTLVGSDWLARDGAIAAVVDEPLAEEHVAALRRLFDSCRGRRARFSVDFVLEAGADACAALGRQANPMTLVLDASRALRLGGVPVRWYVPVLPELAYRLEPIFSLARDERVDAVLVAPHGSGMQSACRPLDADSARFVADFVSYRLLAEERHLLGDAGVDYYRALRDALLAGRALPEAALPPRILLGIDRSGSGWKRMNVAGREAACFDMLAPAGHARPAAASRVSPAEVAGVLLEGAAAGLTQLRALAGAPFRRVPDERSPLPRVLVIGAYGGEHIGDAAILGGVLLRMHRRHGTRHAVVTSQRPDHTRRLVAMLDVPVEIDVQSSSTESVDACLPDVDGVVFGGGPLMDLPKQLVKHLRTVSLARCAGKVVVLEGIGVGPFVRRPSAWTARRIARLADRITVRTSDDARAGVVRGIETFTMRDPAFDYLETREELTRLPDVDRRWVSGLLARTEGRSVVGINLRPVRPDYTTEVAAARRTAYTRFVEARFEERLAEALRRLHKASARPPCFVFFPMNAIQFGLSDLRSAYRLTRLLRGDVDLRVWEGDASIDGVLALVRRLDAVIAMRFHAAIYGLSQRRSVIGIDYRVGLRDKVAALLTDAGQEDRCARIDSMTSEWLFRQLTERLTEARP